jgi:uncharacterized protein
MIKIIEHVDAGQLDIEGKRVILLSGMAGIGAIGKIAVETIRDQFNAELVFSMYMDDFPSQVIVDKQGKLMLPSVQCYHAKITDDLCMFIVTGDVQPASNNGIFVFVEELTSFLIVKKNIKFSLILSIGAYVVEQVAHQPKIFVSGTDSDLINEFVALDADVMRIMEDGIISGANGVIPAFGTLLGIPGVCMLAETVPVVKADPRAAKAVIEMLAKYFSAEFDLSKLEQASAEVDAILDDLARRMRPPGEPADDTATKNRQSYIG